MQNLLQLQVNTGSPAPSPLAIYDISGRKLKTLSLPNGLQAINVSTLPAGTYFLQLTTTNGQLYNQRFVKTN